MSDELDEYTAPSSAVAGFGKSLEDMSFSEMMESGVIDIAEIDDVVVCDQAELVGEPFILYEWDVKASETFGGEYAVCRVKVKNGTRVFADGGVGIREQLERYKNKKMDLGAEAFSPVYFHFGLRSSSYVKELPDGNKVAATTYYFDNRPRP